MIRELNLKEISVLRNKRKNFVLYVYSPTCPHCITGLPIFERAASKSTFKEVYKFNAKPFDDDAKNQELRKEFESRIGPKIMYFPSIFLFYKNGHEYTAVTMDSTNITNKLDAIKRALY